jgi:hypothetical protein
MHQQVYFQLRDLQQLLRKIDSTFVNQILKNDIYKKHTSI